MIWTFVSFLILWGFSRGLAEGITMYFAAPRFHPWFGFYHSFWLCEIGLLFAAGFVACSVHPGLTIYVGAIVLAWETFELGYAQARLGQAKDHENVLGIHSINGRRKVIALHTARLLVGAALISWRYL